MSQYETITSKADAEIRRMLPPEEHIYRPWQLVGYAMENRTLKTTFDEISLLFDKQVILRPGYEIKDGKVYVPNLFVKVTGCNVSKLPLSAADNPNKLLFKSIGEFTVNPGSYITEMEAAGLLDPDGLVDKNRLYDSKVYKYGFLRKEYQDILIQKINYILSNKNSLFTRAVDTSSTSRILFALLNLDEKLLKLFNGYDFQDCPPRIIINNEDKSCFNESNAFTLLLLNLLGFDIFVLSSRGYSDLENIINEASYNVYHSDITPDPDFNTGKKSKKHFSGIFTARYCVLSAVFVSFAVISLIFLLFAPYKEKAASMEISPNAAVNENSTSSESMSNKQVTYNSNNNNQYNVVGILGSEAVNSIHKSNFDQVLIVKVSPDTNLIDGVTTEFTVEVEYNLVSSDTAHLTLNLNNGSEPKINYRKADAIVSKGLGKCVFRVNEKPKYWEDDTPFKFSGYLASPDRNTTYNYNQMFFYPKKQ